ncbi:helix-turn-helix domain-containing protein [Natronobiforma cellulositropha]|uniref:helix-turn-helix domain-containing protein n=1 Tax=Natronobiforma cellulositropha TaxID=1679076 RepID=UPI0021D5B6D4|nr:helix-turn-helix domain-containing protein [Natronobiforma cellulositropha]
MTTVVELEIPADRLGFAQTFDRLGSFEFQIAGMIGDAPPLVWVSGASRNAIRSALEADPTVEVLACLTETGDERWLFRLEFAASVKLFEQLVSANDGAILDASGRSGRWTLELLFHDHAALSEAHTLLRQYDFTTEVTRVTPFGDPSEGHKALTSTQYETIVAAHELGYFDVPRRVTLEELAAELDISHQALSERLRRSHAALVSAELAGRTSPTRIET